ncbi:ABC transporter substrate-binding protein [Ensifer sp. BR816]|uniref:ABC transporter substrate-binding protein n=1 Tax=Rhizobium sp. (strain BR816) TaxID=1057002 RepID=UPI0003799DB8|nr:ABC transporter substrate-binding protein [Ensifer sp. BR816]
MTLGESVPCAANHVVHAFGRVSSCKSGRPAKSPTSLTTLTWFEEHEPLLANAGAAEFVPAYNERAKAAGFPYPHAEYQAAAEYAAWQILAAAAAGAGKLDEAAMAEWLRANTVQTVLGLRDFEGKFNAGKASTKLKQVQDNQWVTVFPADLRPPGRRSTLPEGRPAAGLSGGAKLH